MVLAGVSGHLEGVVKKGRVKTRVVGWVLEDLEDAERLLVGGHDRREQREMLRQVCGRDRAGFAAARRETAVWLQNDRSRRSGLKDLPQYLVVALPAAALGIQSDLVEVVWHAT